MHSFSSQPASYTAQMNQGGTRTVTANNLNDAVNKAQQYGGVRAIDRTDRMGR